MNLQKRLNAVLSRIAHISVDHNHEVQLLAVSKKHSIDKIRQVYQLGHRMFGESYVQEAVEKIQALSDLDIAWHFIGPIQSNKTKTIAQYFSWVQSVDSIKLLSRLNNHRNPEQKPLNVLLQLKVGGEITKRGFEVEELLEVCQQCHQYDNLKIRGLMCIPAPVDGYDEQIQQFEQCRVVYEKMKTMIDVDTLSIGMSSDLEAAIVSGSTMVRVGTDIFGSRI